MGLEGFSMRNIGAYQGTVPSSHLAYEAKELVKVGRENQVKDVNELEKWERIDEEESEEYSGTGGYSEGMDEEEDKKEYDEEKKYSVRINPDSNLIELFDTEKNEILETITPQELILLIKNLNSSSGIFVNKKI